MTIKTKCIRCEREIDETESYTVAGQDYCENCHDDLFVSWSEAYERKEKND